MPANPDGEFGFEEQNERAIRDQLRVVELARLDEEELARRARSRNEAMLAAVVPGRAVCSYTRIQKGSRSMWTDAEGEEAKRTIVCSEPGIRMLAITGTWFCAEHDPLQTAQWTTSCSDCGRDR